MIATKLTGVNLATSYAIVIGYLLALGAMHALWIASLKQKIKAGIIGRELVVKVFYGILFHLFLQSHFTPILYHINYVMSRDNYLI